ncbi:hypothetical protein PIB30_014089 [Stylosanthes scabra]|uniref:Uncharacterized protein n=1 Tax=Stylosanthes scabra TaxID=79078 RepID=A0ABU6S7Y6_9FABA|nr:hypothetical protein [Stylosanthes scabra]
MCQFASVAPRIRIYNSSRLISTIGWWLCSFPAIGIPSGGDLHEWRTSNTNGNHSHHYHCVQKQPSSRHELSEAQGFAEADYRGEGYRAGKGFRSSLLPLKENKPYLALRYDSITPKIRSRHSTLKLHGPLFWRRLLPVSMSYTTAPYHTMSPNLVISQFEKQLF